MTTTAHNELAAAWQQRADGAAAELEHVKTGWALFKPERIQQLLDDHATAVRWVAYWRGIGA